MIAGNTKFTAKSGFTLLELSIVLVIIGLISAGIIIGSDLIKAANIRKQISQIEEMNTAVNTFRLKYNCIPGDCIEAVDLGLAVAGGDGDSGNGNGEVDLGNRTSDNNDPIGLETEDFWYHLGESNLANKYPIGSMPGINSPLLALSGDGPTNAQNNGKGGFWPIKRFLIQPNNVFSLSNTLVDVRRVWMLIGNTNSGVSGQDNGVYSALTTYMIDSKIDDGKPLKGSFMAIMGGVASFYGAPVTEVPIPYDTYFHARLVLHAGNAATPQSCLTDNDIEADYNINASTPINALNRRVARCIPIVKATF
ncbi:MAG: prepilin-type N-terminal cleavage/methylation domain-containing protein [Rickettsiales bacterium]|jgi:prepilin-type N-terminal cleavage/methylation domain-containing protein|nr:prepilin-type N-terminal cleavage/methylation domain-containing protein [Rickettsiales bacterium]